MIRTGFSGAIGASFLQIYRPAAAGKDVRDIRNKIAERHKKVDAGHFICVLNFTLYGFRGRAPLLIDAYLLIARPHKQSALCCVNLKAAPEFSRAPQLKFNRFAHSNERCRLAHISVKFKRVRSILK